MVTRLKAQSQVLGWFEVDLCYALHFCFGQAWRVLRACCMWLVLYLSGLSKGCQIEP